MVPLLIREHRGPDGQPSSKDTDAEVQTVVLRHLLDDSNSEKERLRKLYLEVREQNLTFRSQLDAMAQEGVTTEYSPYHHFRCVTTAYPESSSQRFLRLREMLRDSQSESRDTKRKHALLELDLLRTRTDLATAKRDRKCTFPEGSQLVGMTIS